MPKVGNKREIERFGHDWRRREEKEDEKEEEEEEGKNPLTSSCVLVA